jgi:monoamine oxidase
VWNRPASDGTIVSAGGTWLGKNQERMFDLVEQVGLCAYPQYVGDVDPDDPDDPLNPFDFGAESIFRLDGENSRYKGLFAPIGIEALASLGLALEQLKAIADTVPIDCPWEAPDAHRLDSQTLGEWIDSPDNVPFERARILLRAALTTLFTGDPNAVSLLSSMLLACGGGEDGFNYYIDSGITETHLVDQGAPEVARRMGVALGDALHLSTPVRQIVHGADGVVIFSDAVTVRAQYLIVAMPPAVASQIQYDPPLPTAHSQLMRKMTPNAVWKFVAVYDTPFWRDKGLTGQTSAPQSIIPVTIEASPKPLEEGSDPPYGELAFFATGKDAVTLEQMSPEERKATLMAELVERFDDERAGNPRGFCETNWTTEQWSFGGMYSTCAPGALTAFGTGLREPVGRIFWASTERATLMHGLMEGAVRSGEEQAQAILDALGF